MVLKRIVRKYKNSDTMMKGSEFLEKKGYSVKEYNEGGFYVVGYKNVKIKPKKKSIHSRARRKKP